MLNLDSLTTTKGAKIVCVLEDEGLRPIFNLDLEGLQAATRKDITRNGKDTGVDTKVYVLTGRNFRSRYMTAAEYAEWEENPSWESGPMFMFASTAEEALGMVEDIGSSLLSENKFVGPTSARAAELMMNITVVAIALRDMDCRVCPVPGHECENRNANFDEDALKEAIANFQA